MKTVNPNEAPEGLTAKEGAFSCNGCALWKDIDGCMNESVHCIAEFRDDETNVIFIKKEQQK
mgnify:FL=1